MCGAGPESKGLKHIGVAKNTLNPTPYLQHRVLSSRKLLPNCLVLREESGNLGR